MRKFEAGKNQDNPSKEEIDQHRDFGQVLTNYEETLSRLHKKPLYKDPRAFLVLVVFLLLLYLLLKAGTPEAHHHDSTPQDTTVVR